MIVLSTGEGLWNTGVWPGFGNPKPTLNWAAAGVVVDKSECPFKCEFTDDQSKMVIPPPPPHHHQQCVQSCLVEVVSPDFAEEVARTHSVLTARVTGA